MAWILYFVVKSISILNRIESQIDVSEVLSCCDSDDCCSRKQYSTIVTGHLEMLRDICGDEGVLNQWFNACQHSCKRWCVNDKVVERIFRHVK